MASRGTRSKAETNAALLKGLLKHPGNKFCSDCKTADHPRWASWNIGVFLCIRCSGVHRSMGTHISRVKSVDLDAWTDEQARSMLDWGNTKANKYWEAKLDRDYAPGESRIDNFIKTKYMSRKWAAGPERPDPHSLSDGEDNSSSTADRATIVATPTQSQQPTLAGARIAPEPVRTSGARSRKVEVPPQESLLGLDFGPASPSSAMPAPAPRRQGAAQSNLSLLSDEVPAPSLDAAASNTQMSRAPVRNDLKMSIMSLYASAPKPQTTVPAAGATQGAYGAGHYPATFASGPPPTQRPASAFDDLNGLFGGMNVASAAPPRTNTITPTLSSRRPEPQGVFAAPSPQKSKASVPGSQGAAKQTHGNDPWGDQDDFGGFQTSIVPQGGAQQQQQRRANNAFDDLYSTSDVWK